MPAKWTPEKVAAFEIEDFNCNHKRDIKVKEYPFYSTRLSNIDWKAAEASEK